MKNHPYKLLSLPVEVDEDIVPVVAWLNGLDGVRTLYSCQGDAARDDDKHDRPMVMFVCEDRDALHEIVGNVSDFNHPNGTTMFYQYVTVEVDCQWRQRLRYTIRWFDNYQLKQFISFLGRKASASA